MKGRNSWSRARTATVVGLVVGAIGIAVLWASGVEFPIYSPPGIVILLAGAILVSLASWPWAPGVGAFLGLFVLVGFLISPTGLSNLFGEAGTGVAVGPGDPGGRRAHRPDRRGDRRTSQLPRAGTYSPMSPRCGQGARTLITARRRH